MSKRITLYTDGGASPNPGPGGWGVVILEGEGQRELSGADAKTTNNRMELTAAIRGLEAVVAEADSVQVITDSQYLRRGVTQWLAGWIAKGWRKKDGSAVLNEDLWRRLSELVAGRKIDWGWVKGHAGDRYNERADALATEAADTLRGGPKAERGTTSAAEPVPTDRSIHLRVSCHRGRGRWVGLISDGEDENLIEGQRTGTTGNELEVLAGAELLAEVPKGESVTFFAPSDYLRLGASEWLPGWRSRGWRTAAGKAVKNQSAWQALSGQLGGREIQWRESSERPDVRKRLDKILRLRVTKTAASKTAATKTAASKKASRR